MLELACPEDCQYLIDARAHAGSRESELIRPELTRAKTRSRLESNRFVAALYALDSGVIAVNRGIETEAIRDLVDEEVLLALENVLKNLETADSGLIYEHRPPTMRIQRLSRGIQEALEKAIKEAPPEMRPSRSDQVDAVKLNIERVRAHMKRGGEEPARSRSYLRHVSLYYAWPVESTKPLIISPA